MLRLSRLSDYAIVILSCLMQYERRACTARALAEQTGIPWPTTVKVLKLLSRGRVVRSAQGRRGGYQLVRAPAEISLAEVIETVEGPIGLTECTREEGKCGLRALCPVQGHWASVNSVVRTTLGGISLEDVAALAPPPVDAGSIINPRP